MNLDVTIEKGNARSTLAYMLDNEYFCSWGILQENIISNGDRISDFLDKIDNCETPREINKLVSNYI